MAMALYGLTFMIIAVILILIGYSKKIKLLLIIFSIILAAGGAWSLGIALTESKFHTPLFSLGLVVWIVGAILIYFFMTYRYGKKKITL